MLTDIGIIKQQVDHPPTAVSKPYKCGVPGCGQSFAVHDELLQHGVSAH
jgi:hypothetical protein